MLQEILKHLDPIGFEFPCLHQFLVVLYPIEVQPSFIIIVA